MDRILLALGIFALWFVPSVGQLTKYAGNTGAVISAAAGFSVIVLLIKWTNRSSPELLRSLAVGLMPVLVAVTIVAFLVLYPISKSSLMGPGSDSSRSALDVALKEVLDGLYPYDARTYLGNPPTPAPGALLLAAPFFYWWQRHSEHILAATIFILQRIRIFADPWRAVVFYSICFLACPGALQDFVTGGDYLVNAIYVGVAVSLVAGAHETPSSRSLRWATYLFLAVTASSRAFYAVTIPVLAYLFGPARRIAGGHRIRKSYCYVRAGD